MDKNKKFFKSVLENVTIAYPQNLETRNYLKKMKINNIKLIGNIKFAENNNKFNDKLNESLNSELVKKKFGLHQAHIKMKKFFVQKVT